MDAYLRERRHTLLIDFFANRRKNETQHQQDIVKSEISSNASIRISSRQHSSKTRSIG